MMKSKILFVLTIVVIVCLSYFLSGCAITGESIYTAADGTERKQVNAAIVMPFSPTSADVTIAQKNEEGEWILIADDADEYQDGWIPEVGSRLGSAALFADGLSDSGNVINNSSSSLSNSESLGGSVDLDFMYKPKHKHKGYSYR